MVSFAIHLFCELTGLVRRGHYFIVEYREIQGQTQPNGVGGLHGRFGDVEGILVGLLGVVNYGLPGVSIGDLGEIPEVVSLHLEVENLPKKINQ